MLHVKNVSAVCAEAVDAREYDALSIVRCCLQGWDGLSVAKIKRRRFLPNRPLRFIIVQKAPNSSREQHLYKEC